VLFQAVSSTAALRLMLVTVAPPTEFTGARPLLDASAADFTSIAGIEGATPMEADFTTTPAAVAPTWWDFGDGEWDYVVAPGSASHIYEVSGTYTVRASQNGLVWTETTVTVPFP
jgi:PKD repeat protein